MIPLWKRGIMSRIEVRIKKFYRKPIPNDITIRDVEVLAIYFGCVIRAGGKHGVKVVHIPSGTVIPVPIHGKYIKGHYIKQLIQLFDRVEEEA